MIVAIFLVVFTLLAYFANPFIRKHNILLYIMAVVISALAFIFKDFVLMMPIIKGFLGLSLFYIVMITGTLKNKSKLKIKLMGVRREYSIIGFIVLIPHALDHVLKLINGTNLTEWFGFAAFVLMIPLFITSFLIIRKKMKNKTWRVLQSLAYIIYILFFVHLIINYTKTINLVLYVIIFTLYFVMKIIYEINKYRTKKKKEAVQSTEK